LLVEFAWRAGEKEIEVNLRDGRQRLLHAEDMLRYNAKGFTINTKAVIDSSRL